MRLKRQCAALTFVLVVAASGVGAAAEPSPISLHPDNGHYFLFRGKPTVLVTSTEHYGAVLNGDFDYVPYLDELKALLSPGQSDARRAFLAGGTTDSRITPEEIAGKRVSIITLDGRPLTIDATGEELLVGDAEALDVRRLPDGKVIYVLDHALTR